MKMQPLVPTYLSISVYGRPCITKYHVIHHKIHIFHRCLIYALWIWIKEPFWRIPVVYLILIQFTWEPIAERKKENDWYHAIPYFTATKKCPKMSWHIPEVWDCWLVPTNTQKIWPVKGNLWMRLYGEAKLRLVIYRSPD